MTKTEAVKLVTIAVACFPTQQERDMAPTVTAWLEMLGDLDYSIAMAALKKVLATAKFFPTVAEIREAAASLMPSDVPEPEKAWAELLQQMKTVGYMRTPEWSHPVIGKVVDAMWGSWTNACASVMQETIGVDRAQFLRMYATMTKREREALLLPSSVREAAGLLTAGLTPHSAR